MLSIIVNYNSYNTIKNLIDYINHINNINTVINIPLELIVIKCCNTFNNTEINKIQLENKPNFNINVYNYFTDYDDSIYNEIIHYCVYENILFTSFDIFITPILFEWIKLNNIQDNTFVRTNVFTIEQIPKMFYTDFNNIIYSHISHTVKQINNELGTKDISQETFINEFNNNIDINIISPEEIKKKCCYYLQYTDKFLLVNKNTMLKCGFNTDNTKHFQTFQYIISHLIKQNYSMVKLPYMISCYKIQDTTKLSLIDININYELNSSCNKMINYNLYSVNKNITSKFIRNKIKNIRGYNPVETVRELEVLKKKIKLLETTNQKLIEENDSFKMSGINVTSVDNVNTTNKLINIEVLKQKINSIEEYLKQKYIERDNIDILIKQSEHEIEYLKKLYNYN
tara:strand:+ start:2589 stop:3785 length:1197 start_codon:yes stop_codon:yes gene_type:complete